MKYDLSYNSFALNPGFSVYMHTIISTSEFQVGRVNA